MMNRVAGAFKAAPSSSFFGGLARGRRNPTNTLLMTPRDRSTAPSLVGGPKLFLSHMSSKFPSRVGTSTRMRTLLNNRPSPRAPAFLAPPSFTSSTATSSSRLFSTRAQAPPAPTSSSSMTSPDVSGFLMQVAGCFAAGVVLSEIHDNYGRAIHPPSAHNPHHDPIASALHRTLLFLACDDLSDNEATRVDCLLARFTFLIDKVIASPYFASLRVHADAPVEADGLHFASIPPTTTRKASRNKTDSVALTKADDDADVTRLLQYEMFLRGCLTDGIVGQIQRKRLEEMREELGITETEHYKVLGRLDYTAEDFEYAIDAGVGTEMSGGRDVVVTEGRKDNIAAYVTWAAGGLIGVHRMYLGLYKTGMIMFLCWVPGAALVIPPFVALAWWVRDFFKLADMVELANVKARARQIAKRMKPEQEPSFLSHLDTE
eukprot:TRINITY_DN127_c1_g2_i1.p2 TRINITY_DN127_c1_g2~~TRINITY_DN127_c1_g2_i1.p2  ORF type:complete len:432 (+),score=82.54 TRINITY_DN127_c1_g2_i1:2270-3565(+)